MRRFLLRRLGWFALTLFAVVTLSFALMRGVRGGPFDSERPLPAAVERNLREAYHLDWPLWKQYLEYTGPLELGQHGARALGGDGTRVFGGLLAGDFGPSFRYRDFTVNDILAQSLPISLTLGTLALLFALSVGIPAGLASALLRGRPLDVALRIATSLGIALPGFVLASALLFLFAIVWPLFPVAGYGSWRHLVLPALALGAPFAAYAARLVRTGALEVLGQDYVRTARAKGLPESRVLLRHVLPGALLPLVSWLGPAAAGVLTGSLVVERIFAIPGTGSHFVNSALNRDYTLAMGVTILYTALVYGFNLLVDLAYGWIDPRMRAGEQARMPRSARIAAWFLVALALLALCAPLLPLPSPVAIALRDRPLSPCWPWHEFGMHAFRPEYWQLSWIDARLVELRQTLFGDWQTGHWLGTDAKGRDLLARIVWGSRTSCEVALLASLTSLVIGVGWGALAGFAGGRVDNAMMRFVDLCFSLPFVFLVIFLIGIVNEYRPELGRLGIDRETVFFVLLGAFTWLAMARVVRGQVLALKKREFVEAARVLGASRTRILCVHILPNVLPVVLVYLTLTVPAVMLSEAFLSFLGLGIEPPKVSWGLLAVEGAEALTPLSFDWWLVAWPSLAIALTLLSLNVLGDALRDRFDPRLGEVRR